MSYPPSGPFEAPRNGSNRAAAIGLAVTVAALVTAIVVVCAVTLTSRGRSVADERPSITLQAVGASARSPFTASVAKGDTTVQPANIGTPNNRGIKGVAGTVAGLYGSSGSTACDPQLLSNYLTRDSGASKAWASAAGVTTAQIPYYINTLTPVILRTDAWVTNNEYSGGQAQPYQAVLQAGTSVLVDRSGVPRVQCATGAPLAPPARAPLKGYKPRGQKWTDFNPSNVTAVDYSAAAVAVPDGGRGYETGQPTVRVELPLVDIRTGAVHSQPVGGDVSLIGLPPIVGALPDPIRANEPFVATTDASAHANGMDHAGSDEPLPIVKQQTQAPVVPSLPSMESPTPPTESTPQIPTTAATAPTTTSTSAPTAPTIPSTPTTPSIPTAPSMPTAPSIPTAPTTPTTTTTPAVTTPTTPVPAVTTPTTPVPEVTTPTTPVPAATPTSAPVRTPVYTPPPVTTPAYTPPPETTQPPVTTTTEHRHHH